MDHPPDYWGKRERAEEARALLGSPIFGMAVRQLRNDMIDELLKEPVGSEQIVAMHAKLKLLDDVVGAIERYVTDEKFKQRERE